MPSIRILKAVAVAIVGVIGAIAVTLIQKDVPAKAEAPAIAATANPQIQMNPQIIVSPQIQIAPTTQSPPSTSSVTQTRIQNIPTPQQPRRAPVNLRGFITSSGPWTAGYYFEYGVNSEAPTKTQTRTVPVDSTQDVSEVVAIPCGSIYYYRLVYWDSQAPKNVFSANSETGSTEKCS